jgi:hypothetical protein
MIFWQDPVPGGMWKSTIYSKTIPSPQSLLYFCENPQVSTVMNGNMRQHTYGQ